MDLVHGSAVWMYRLLIKTLLGVNLEGDRLRLAPHLPKSWTTCKIHCRYRHTVYHITITRLIADAAGANQVFLDGEELAVNTVPLVDDRREHSVELKVWSPANAPKTGTFFQLWFEPAHPGLRKRGDLPPATIGAARQPAGPVFAACVQQFRVGLHPIAEDRPVA